jgi:hypothetical protein
MKALSLRGLTGCLSASILLTVGVAATPASAASTRAEYVAQVDPICQSFVGPTVSAGSAYNKDYKEWTRRLSKGTLKGWVRQTRRTARSLGRFNELHAALTEQIAAVPPPAADVAAISTWLDDRRQADVFSVSAASAFGHFKFAQFHKKINQANAADAAGVTAISGFGFLACGVSV